MKSATTLPIVLMVDDERMSRETMKFTCQSAIESGEFRLLECGSLQEASQILSEEDVQVLLLDKNLGPEANKISQNGIESIPTILALKQRLKILMVTGSENRQDIVKAMSYGAFGYVVKGEDPEELVMAQIRNAIKYAQLDSESFNLRLRNKGSIQILGSSAAARQLRSQVEILSQNNAPVLLSGETGVGKSTVAEKIHELGKNGCPYVHLNAASIPEELAERELFGNERGAFTGAVEAKPGAVELANGGTLFLDEIADLSLDTQAKILIVLDKGVFRRLGGTVAKKSKFRLITATNKDLDQLVKEGKFREDLLRRISIINICVPSVRDRIEDIPEIIESIWGYCCEMAETRGDPSELPADFIEHLKANPPPANIGGIVQQVTRLMLFCPRDRDGRPIYKQWRLVPGIVRTCASKKSVVDAITVDEIERRPFDVVGTSKFENVNDFMQLVSDKVYRDAREKNPGKNLEVAEALGLSPGIVSINLTKLGLSQRQRKKK